MSLPGFLFEVRAPLEAAQFGNMSMNHLCERLKLHINRAITSICTRFKGHHPAGSFEEGENFSNLTGTQQPTTIFDRAARR